jgi:hypothetical protein
MWARVKKALDPAGDGRYEVEYRVKQIDGSWRWLSAWGLVEFDGIGAGSQAGRDRAHDLLTERSWSGAELREVVARAMEPFAVAQINCAGDALEISPKHALALSLALQELATNAAKYGALSSPNGRVELRWRTDAGMLHVTWTRECFM